jgi:hypothetical protein
MKTPVLFYGYLFFNRVGINIKKDMLESKSLLSLVQSMSTPFALERRLYNYEICVKALKTGTSNRWETSNSKSPGPIKLSSQSIAGVKLCCAYWHQHLVREGSAKPACFDKVSGGSGFGNII